MTSSAGYFAYRTRRYVYGPETLLYEPEITSNMNHLAAPRVHEACHQRLVPTVSLTQVMREEVFLISSEMTRNFIKVIIIWERAKIHMMSFLDCRHQPWR